MNYDDIVREHPPHNAFFTEDGGYIIKGHGHIPWELCVKVQELRAEFGKQDPMRFPNKCVPTPELVYNTAWGVLPMPQAKN